MHDVSDKTGAKLADPPQPAQQPQRPPQPAEIGGPVGPEPTRYGDWEYNGRCTDF